MFKLEHVVMKLCINVWCLFCDSYIMFFVDRLYFIVMFCGLIFKNT